MGASSPPRAPAPGRGARAARERERDDARSAARAGDAHCHIPASSFIDDFSSTKRPPSFREIRPQTGIAIATRFRRHFGHLATMFLPLINEVMPCAPIGRSGAGFQIARSPPLLHERYFDAAAAFCACREMHFEVTRFPDFGLHMFFSALLLICLPLFPHGTAITTFTHYAAFSPRIEPRECTRVLLHQPPLQEADAEMSRARCARIAFLD